MDCSPPGSSVHGILQPRILEWVAIPYSGDLPDPGIKPTSPALAGGFFATSTTGEAPPVSSPCTTSVKSGNTEKTPLASGTPFPEDGSEIFTTEKGAGQILIQYRTVKS